MSIRLKLFAAFLVCTLVPTMLLGLFSYVISARAVEQTASEAILPMLRQMNHNLETSVSELDRIAVVPYTDKETQRILATQAGSNTLLENRDRQNVLDNLLQNMIVTRRDIRGITLFSLPGLGASKVLADIGVRTRPGFELSAEPWYPRLRRSDGGMTLLGPLREPSTSPDPPLAFGIARIIRNVETGEDIGVLLMLVDFRTIIDICSETGAVPGGRTLVYDEEGTIVYDKDPSLIGSKSPEGSTLAEAAHTNTQQAVIDSIDYRIYRESSSYLGWTVAFFAPVRAFARASRFIRTATLLLMLVAVAGALIAARGLSRGLSDRLLNLRRTMKLVEAGDFKVQVPVRGRDEVGDLSRSFAFMLQTIDELIETEYRTELRRKDAEADALQSRINPHFLYNTLEVIRAMALSYGAEDIDTVCESLALIFRYAADSGRRMVPLADELEAARRFLLIQAFRFPGRFSTTFEVATESESLPVPRLLIQPIVENSMHYAVEGARGARRIVVRSLLLDGILRIEVEDDGPGIEPPRLAVLREALESGKERFEPGFAHGSGIGLLNVNARLRLGYGSGAGLQIVVAVPGRTLIRLQLPIALPTSWPGPVS